MSKTKTLNLQPITPKKTNVVITLGPTDESIDDVMKITNMSTGGLGVEIARALMTHQGFDAEIKLWLICNNTTYRANKTELDELLGKGAQMITLGGVKNGQRVTSETDDLLNELTELFQREKIDYLFHAAAVGDYTGKFATSASLLAEEIAAAQKAKGESLSVEELQKILAQPSRVFNQDTKMSSDEKQMIVGLGQTPKVISHIMDLARKNGHPTKLISWKLLSDVSQEELFEIALKHGQKNGSWRVVANDLARIGGGQHWAMIIDPATGTFDEAQTKQEIAQQLAAQITGLAPGQELL